MMAIEMTYFTGFETITDPADLAPEISTSGTIAVETNVSKVRSGTRGISLAGFNNSVGGASMILPVVDSAAVAIGLGLYFIGSVGAADRSVVDIRNSGGSLKSRISLTRHNELQVRVGDSLKETSISTIPTDAMVFVEVVYRSDSSTGLIEVYVNNTLFVTFAGDTVGASGNVASVLLRAFTRDVNASVGSGRTPYSDVYLAEWDGSGDSRFGPGEPIYFVPTSDVTAQGTPSAGSDNFAMVDELPNDGDTTHVTFDAGDQKDVYGVDWSALPAGQIRGVMVQSTQRLPDGGTTQVRHLIDNGVTEYAGPDLSVGDTFGTRSALWAENPDGSVAWTQGAVQALRVGVQARD